MMTMAKAMGLLLTACLAASAIAGNTSRTTDSPTTHNIDNVTDLTSVAGVLTVGIHVRGTISEKALKDTFTRAITAAALQAHMEFVMTLTTSEVKQVSNLEGHLQNNQTNHT